MGEKYLPEFGGAYLEDSYFLGLLAEGADLRFTLLLALTADHPDYAPPNQGEAHCYRKGSILLEQPSIVQWQPGKPTVTRDLNGTFDLGSIELYQRGPTRFRFVTEWFEAVVDVAGLQLRLSDATV